MPCDNMEETVRSKSKIIRERFFEKVELIPFHTCWEWIAGKNSSGYGLFNYLGKPISSHRVSWLLHNGDIPNELYVLHKCDNRTCVNPDHLFLGTHKDNQEDKIKKGRQWHPYGIKNKKAKLNLELVNEIKKKYSTNKYTQFELSVDYKVCRSTIAYIVRHETWIKP